MKSDQLLALLVLFVASLLQTTLTLRVVVRRELTEYDLTNFIVNTCSSDRPDMVIQNLCDQTLQSTLGGHFPFLKQYCKERGAGKRYCGKVNRLLEVAAVTEAKRYPTRRRGRSLAIQDSYGNEDGETQNLDILIIQMCLAKSSNRHRDLSLCNRTMEQARQHGQSPEIARFCASHPTFSSSIYCSTPSNTTSDDDDSPLSSLPSSSKSSSLLSLYQRRGGGSPPPTAAAARRQQRPSFETQNPERKS